MPVLYITINPCSGEDPNNRPARLTTIQSFCLSYVSKYIIYPLIRHWFHPFIKFFWSEILPSLLDYSNCRLIIPIWVSHSLFWDLPTVLDRREIRREISKVSTSEIIFRLCSFFRYLTMLLFPSPCPESPSSSNTKSFPCLQAPAKASQPARE